MTWDIEGKICLVTGANSGIGKETARGLAARGAEVLMHGRREDALEAARDEVAADTGNEELSTVLADFADLSDVRSMAGEVLERWDRLDVLVNNAGGVLDDRRVTTDGNEAQFQINHLAPFLLTHELLDRIQQSAPARIINVASEAHWNVRKVPDTLQSLEGKYSSFGVYSQTKLYNILFTSELARRLDPQEVTVNCLHPGVISSNFGSEGPWYVRGFMKIARPFLTDPEDGARTSLHLATDPDVDRVTGSYFKDEQPAQTSSLAKDEALQQALWEESEALTGADAWPAPQDPAPTRT